MRGKQYEKGDEQSKKQKRREKRNCKVKGKIYSSGEYKDIW
jgi:hypothetical protein